MGLSTKLNIHTEFPKAPRALILVVLAMGVTLIADINLDDPPTPSIGDNEVSSGDPDLTVDCEDGRLPDFTLVDPCCQGPSCRTLAEEFPDEELRDGESIGFIVTVGRLNRIRNCWQSKARDANAASDEEVVPPDELTTEYEYELDWRTPDNCEAAGGPHPCKSAVTKRDDPRVVVVRPHLQRHHAFLHGCNKLDHLMQVVLHEHKHVLQPDPTDENADQVFETNAQIYAWRRYKAIFNKIPCVPGPLDGMESTGYDPINGNIEGVCDDIGNG